MRKLAIALAVLTFVVPTVSSATAKPDATLRASQSGLTLSGTDLQARLKGTPATGLDKAELGMDLDFVQARLFRNTVVAPDFSGSRLHYGRAVRSPYLQAIGVGDGFSARLSSGPYSIAAAALSGPAGDSLAAELAALDGAMALQAGHRDTGRETGSTSFAGAHVDFDVLHAELSLRWHAGREEVADGVRETSAGGVALGLSSLLEDGDHLRAAMSRPVRADFGLEAPDLQLLYRVPLPIGQLTGTSGVETAARVTTVRVSWGLRW